MNFLTKNKFQTMNTLAAVSTALCRFGLFSLLISSLFVFYGCPDRNFPNPNSADPATAGVQSLVTGVESSMRNAVGYLYAPRSSDEKPTTSAATTHATWLNTKAALWIQVVRSTTTTTFSDTM